MPVKNINITDIDPDYLYTPWEVSELTGESYWCVIKHIEKGTLAGYKRVGGGRYLVPGNDVIQWFYNGLADKIGNIGTVGTVGTVGSIGKPRPKGE